MWCIGVLNEQYRSRMYDLLALYAKPLCSKDPVICIDEKSLQLIGHSRQPLPMAAHAPTKDPVGHPNSPTLGHQKLPHPNG